MKRLSSIVLISSLLIVFAGIAYADEYSRKSLQGLKGVGVVIEPIFPSITGLSEEVLRTQVELQLRKYGIMVLTRDEMSEESGIPVLFLAISPVQLDKIDKPDIYFYQASLAFKQMAFLKRNSKEVIAETWIERQMGYCGSGLLVGNIREAVNSLMETFVNDYLAVNPK